MALKIAPSFSNEQEEFKIYPERWWILATCMTLTMGNIMQWMSYSALIQETNQYFCGEMQCSASFLSNQIYQLVAALFCVVGMWAATKLGVLYTLRICAMLNFLGAAIRLISSIPWIENFGIRVAIMLFGTTVAACSQMYFVITTKLAESWFHSENRASANVACMNSVPLGAVLGSFIPSLIIPTDLGTTISNTWIFFELNSIILLITLVPLVIAFGFCKNSNPPTPPSRSSRHSSGPEVLTQIKICLKNPQFLVQILIYCINFAPVMGIIFVSEHLTILKYDLKGFPVAISTLAGILAAYLVGVLVDRTRWFKEVVMVNCVVQAVVLAGLRWFLEKEHENRTDSIIVCLLCGIVMSTSSIHIPIGCELGVETTYPVHESISTGILNAIGQLWLFIFFFILYDLEYAGWLTSINFWLTTSILNSFLALIFLRPTYNRMKVENQK
ncbi:unnamed protein product [Caenorhabditis angaria]|uniref:Major facilitator superfamily (MFS) profile domain-containing protein n=1 Tax=Caenorhabditis angaria TaxID=860376 RepID=A0A9P1IZ38_9PELO|nr:unnamed protein product [Caenorhabditis angaria]